MSCRKRWLIFFLTMGLCMAPVAASWAAGDAFPTKPITLVCPYGAGGSTSMGSRIIAGTLGAILGKPVVVLNKTGAGGTIGAEYVAKSKPDGYRLFVFNSGSNGVAVATRKIRYTNADFQLLGQYAKQPMGLVVSANSPWKTLAELIADIKKNPGKFTYGTSGMGTSGSFGMELFKLASGNLKINHVPFKSGPEVMAALLGGHINMSFFYMVDFKGPVQAGRLRLLATAGEKRLKAFPNVPTFVESGYPAIKMYAWYGVAAPKGVPKDVFTKLKDAFYKTCATKDVKRMLSKIGYVPFFRTSEEFSAFVKSEDKKFARVAKEANIGIK